MIRVLYLAGSGGSGSTLVTTALGQLDGVFAAGELRYLWHRGLVERLFAPGDHLPGRFFAPADHLPGVRETYSAVSVP